MNLLVILWEFIKYLVLGLWAGFEAVLKIIPLYEQLSGLKEEIIVAGLGVPVLVITIIGAIPVIIRISLKIVDQFA